MTHSLTQADSVLTQLIFGYSLQMRSINSMVASTGKASAAGSTTDGGSSSKKLSNMSSSLEGKLNNLATVDLSNIVAARDLVIVCESFLPCLYLLAELKTFPRRFQFGNSLFK
jgi:hypothetical protein